MPSNKLKPGQRVRLVQEIKRREGNWRGALVGKLVRAGCEPTGSWFAHGKNDRLWLGRVWLEKQDGELTSIVVDEHTRLEVLDEAGPPA